MSEARHSTRGNTWRSAILSPAQASAKPLAAFDSEFPSPALLKSVEREALGETSAGPAPAKGRRRLGAADQLLVRARELFQQAKREVEEARADADEIARDAYQEGFRQGEKAGEELGLAKQAPVIEEVDALLGRLADAHRAVVEENKEQLITLALAIVSRILHRTLEAEPDQILQTTEEVLNLVRREQHVRLRLSQTDFQVLLEHQGELPALARLGDRLTFEVDPDMIPGGCIAQTPTGTIDATIESMFDEMRRALTSQRTTYHTSAPSEA